VRRSPAWHALAIVAAGSVLSSCGVPTGDSSFSEIQPDEIPFGLDQPATTTTSTTTTTTTTTIPETPITTPEQTTTTIALEPVISYFVSRGELQPVTVELPRDYSRNQLVSQLEAGRPLGAAGVGLETFIEPGLITDTEEQGGVVTVTLDGAVFDEIDPSDQRLVIAQIVLTFTANLRGVGQVAFVLDGEPLRVQKGDGLLAEEDTPVSFDDYQELLVDGPSTSSTTTEPPTESPSDPSADPTVTDDQ
jgi:hypothetical protein